MSLNTSRGFADALARIGAISAYGVSGVTLLTAKKVTTPSSSEKTPITIYGLEKLAGDDGSARKDTKSGASMEPAPKKAWT